MKPPYAIGSVPSLSGHAIAYRWRSLPRVRQHRASKPQGSSERVLPWQVAIDQLICPSLSHNHCWYEVGMLKVPAGIHIHIIGVMDNVEESLSLATDRRVSYVVPNSWKITNDSLHLPRTARHKHIQNKYVK